MDAEGSSEAEARARAEEALRRLPPRLQHGGAWLLSRWPGRIVIRSAENCVRLGIFDRSMTIAAQLFTSVLPILILFATWMSAFDTRQVADAVSMPDESRVVLEDAVSGAGGAAFGVVGTLMVLVSATSLSRALTRAFAEVWGQQRPRTRLSSAWRWLAVVVVMALSLVVVRTLIAAAGELPPPGVWQVAVSLLCDTALALFVPWVLLAGTVRPRHLAPGALAFGLLMLTMRPASVAWLPRALENSAAHYGSLGVAFTYLAWLYLVAFVLLGTALVGQAIATDQGQLGRWIRGRDVQQTSRSA